MSSQHTEGSELTQDTDLSRPWFSDGHITLIAGDSSFRVFKSILAAHSTFFRDLFLSATDEDPHGSDGLPILQLHDDPAELSCFLRAIFDSRYAPNCTMTSDAYIQLLPQLLQRASIESCTDHFHDRRCSASLAQVRRRPPPSPSPSSRRTPCPHDLRRLSRRRSSQQTCRYVLPPRRGRPGGRSRLAPTGRPGSGLAASTLAARTPPNTFNAHRRT